jgi:hypothetical protein
MKCKLDAHVISTLQMEYNACRQEIRDLINSMDTNLNVSITMIGGAVALASFTKEFSVLYIIPSIIFMATCAHLIKTASANVHGAYCQVIEARLKFLLDKEVLLDWEGGKVFQHIAGPAGIVQLGFYLYFIGVSAIFAVVAVLAYRWKSWTAYVHVSEFAAVLVYALLAIRWNSSSRRTEIVGHYRLSDDEVSDSHQSASTAAQLPREPDA